jgi:hypothetical protein
MHFSSEEVRMINNKFRAVKRRLGISISTPFSVDAKLTFISVFDNREFITENEKREPNNG